MVQDGHKERYIPSQHNKKNVMRKKETSQQSHENTSWYNSKTANINNHSSWLRAKQFPSHFSQVQEEEKHNSKVTKKTPTDLSEK